MRLTIIKTGGATYRPLLLLSWYAIDSNNPVSQLDRKGGEGEKCVAPAAAHVNKDLNFPGLR